MTKHDDRGDGKILAIVAGGVVLSAVVIVLLAGLATQEGEESERVISDRTVRPAVRQTSPSPSPVMPTAWKPEPVVTPLPEQSETVVTTVAQESAEPSTPPFAIDPDADFRAEAYRAWTAREYDKAAAYFEAHAESRPDHAYTLYMLGLSRWKSGDTSGAAAAMQRSAECNGQSIKTFVNLCRIRNDGGEYDAALEAAEQALAIEEDNADALFVKARSLYNLGRVDEAGPVLESSLALNDDNGYGHNLMGLIRLDRGSADEARQAFERAVQLCPDVAFVQNNLGSALEQSGDATGALAAFRRAQEIDPSHERSAASVARLEALLPAVGPPQLEEETAMAESQPATLPEEDEEPGAGL